MRIEPIAPIYPLRNSKDKNKEERQGFDRAFEEQKKRHEEERKKNKDVLVLSKRLRKS